MDNDIKSLLEKLITKQEDILKRIEALESKAHDQITLEDYYRKYGVLPGQTFPLPMAPSWTTNPWVTGPGPTVHPLRFDQITIC
jgi:hypothetical protein